MKTAIVYASKHGCTEKCAKKIQNGLNVETKIFNLKNTKEFGFVEFDRIIIGGSIHAGQIQKKVKNFCQNNIDILKAKKIGLFLFCMEEGETAQKQFDEAFPKELIQHASATGILGGEFNFEKMNFFEKTIVKKIAKINTSVSKISEEKIDAFISQLRD